MNIEPRATYSSEPTIYKRSDLFSLIGLTTLNCNATLSNQKKWLIYLEKNGELITLNDNPTLNYAELVIQPQTLAYGLYKIVYSVNNDDSNFEVDTYVQIVPSGLIVSSLSLAQPMYGGIIEIIRGSNQSISFNPFLNTIDLDNICVITTLTFKYSCQSIDSNSPNGYPKSENNQTIHLDEFQTNSSLLKYLQCFNSTGYI